MSVKRAIEKRGLNQAARDYLNEAERNIKVNASGVGCDDLVEPVPNYLSAKCEKVISGKNNAWIVLGRDRPGSRLSGYGGKGDTQAASIDIVVGRMGSADVQQVNEKNEQLWTDPNFKKDSSRVYISQKTDVDKNFGLSQGKVGNSHAKAAIAIKSDAVRVIAREGIKLITRTDVKNSQGAKVETVSGIDLIAGNDDTDLQSIPKGENLAEALKRITHHLDKLNGIVDAFLMTQMEYNEALLGHFHYSPFFAVPTTPSIDVVVPKGVKTLINQLAKVKRSLVMHKVNLKTFEMTYLTPAGGKYINSRYNSTN